ncbi:MAG: hypothetical protein IPP17_21695 [Bacteroidetes bacterium]|nr:hypothetical protein [Bacteroidota bacterium]
MGANLLHAQQPAYFILGEDEFKGLQIYDVIQDQQDNYLISTNEGIYYYDYQHFARIGCSEAKSNSVFNFVADADGNVYCCNLNHQIFSIRNGACALLYELQDDEVSSDISLAIGPDNNLIAAAKKVIVIDSEGKALRRFGYPASHCGQPFTLKNRFVIYHLPGRDSVIIANPNGFTTQQVIGLTHPWRSLVCFPSSESEGTAMLSICPPKVCMPLMSGYFPCGFFRTIPHLSEANH